MMGKIVVTEFISIDGVMEAPGGEPGYKHSGWVLRQFNQEWLDYKLQEVLSHEAHLLGRITYESFAGAWPSRVGEFAVKVNAMPKYVASSTLKKPEWNNSHVLQGDTAKAVAKLKTEIKGDILVAGSRTLVRTLKEAVLVDEYRLMIFPIVLGSGMRLFDTAEEALSLKLAGTQAFDCGVVVLTYHPMRSA
jgi:dihydrofolate reductase